MALGQAKRSLPDLDKVLELKPDFHQVNDYSCIINDFSLLLLLLLIRQDLNVPAQTLNWENYRQQKRTINYYQ